MTTLAGKLAVSSRLDNTY